MKYDKKLAMKLIQDKLDHHSFLQYKEIAEITGIGRGVVQTRTLYAFEEICEDEHGYIEGRLMRQNSLENEGKLRRAGIRP